MDWWIGGLVEHEAESLNIVAAGIALKRDNGNTRDFLRASCRSICAGHRNCEFVRVKIP